MTRRPDGPWPLIRWVESSAPYWWAAVRRSGSSIVQVSSAAGLPTASLTPTQQWYYSLQYGLGRIILPPPVGHPKGARLRLVVERRLESNSLEAIARSLPGRPGRETVRGWLREAYYWLCDPAGGSLGGGDGRLAGGASEGWHQARL